MSRESPPCAICSLSPDQGSATGMTSASTQDVARDLTEPRGGWEPPGDFGAVAMPLGIALGRLSANQYFLELRQTYT
jgi:hypothetical protein